MNLGEWMVLCHKHLEWKQKKNMLMNINEEDSRNLKINKHAKEKTPSIIINEWNLIMMVFLSVFSLV